MIFHLKSIITPHVREKKIVIFSSFSSCDTTHFRSKLAFQVKREREETKTRKKKERKGKERKEIMKYNTQNADVEQVSEKSSKEISTLPDTCTRVELNVEFKSGRKTDRPHVLWHSETNSIWVRGIYRREEKANLVANMRLKLKPRIYSSESLLPENQKIASKRFPEEICDDEILRSSALVKRDNIITSQQQQQQQSFGSTDSCVLKENEKMAMVFRMKFVQEQTQDEYELDNVFGGYGEESTLTHNIIVQRNSSDPGFVTLGACFFTKIEQLEEVSPQPDDLCNGGVSTVNVKKKVYRGKFDLVLSGITEHRSPEIRLVVPTTYKRYIEKVGEEKAVFIKSIVYRPDIGKWTFVPISVKPFASRIPLSPKKQTVWKTKDHDDHSESSSPSKPQKQKKTPSLYPYVKTVNGMNIEKAKKICFHFFAAQELMPIKNIMEYSIMVSDTIRQKALAVREQKLAQNNNSSDDNEDDGDEHCKEKGKESADQITDIDVEAQVRIRKVHPVATCRVKKEEKDTRGDNTDTTVELSAENVNKQLETLWRQQQTLDQHVRSIEHLNQKLVSQNLRILEALREVGEKRKLLDSDQKQKQQQEQRSRPFKKKRTTT